MIRKLFCYFGFHKWIKTGANQYGYCERCLFCSKKRYISYLAFCKTMGSPIDYLPPIPEFLSELSDLKLKNKE